MARGRGGRRSAEYGEFWPGYVDVLSTLLLTVTFLMSIFMVSQYFVSQEATGKDSALRRLTRQIAELTSLLSLEKGKAGGLQDELAQLNATIAVLKQENARLAASSGLGEEKAAAAAGRIASLDKELEEQRSLSSDALARVDLLNQQLLALRRQLSSLQEAVNAAEAKDKDAQLKIDDLGRRLNVALARQVQELQRYRSDFFGRLRDLLKDRKDIRVVQDRFVFQSEVLFPSGQAQVTVEGLAALDQLAGAIVELEKSIPPEIDWALQVDGHTDARPIASSQFPSNWELSTARSISVVRYLISRGVSAKRLVAAGYGEFQPLEPGDGEETLRRNRRIELKLTNR
jgi:chemotaxis protein MotB